MAALEGFDTAADTATVTAPITAGQTLLTLAVPARTTVAGLDMSVSQLDTNAAPLLAIDIGDAVDDDRFVANDETAQEGTGEDDPLEYRPLNTAWYRYSAASSILVSVRTSAATSQAGALSLTLYSYLSHDIATVVRTALRNLGVLAEGETARAEDYAIALEALSDIHEVLRGKKLGYRQDLEWTLAAIPLFAARPYAWMAADLMADTFGLSQQRKAALGRRASEAEREMRRQTRTPSAGNPVDMEPYLADDTTTLDTSILA